MNTLKTTFTSYNLKKQDSQDKVKVKTTRGLELAYLSEAVKGSDSNPKY